MVVVSKDSDYSVSFEPQPRLNNSLDSLYWSFIQNEACRSCNYEAVYLEVSIINVLTLTMGLVVDLVRIVPCALLLLCVLYPADGDQDDHGQDQQ